MVDGEAGLVRLPLTEAGLTEAVRHPESMIKAVSRLKYRMKWVVSTTKPRSMGDQERSPSMPSTQGMRSPGHNIGSMRAVCTSLRTGRMA